VKSPSFPAPYPDDSTRKQIINKHYTLNYPVPPNSVWEPIDGTSSVSTDLTTSHTSFNKILFNAPVDLTTSSFLPPGYNYIPVSITDSSSVSFYKCMFNMQTNAGTAISTSNIIYPTDVNGQLITTSDGLRAWYGNNAIPFDKKSSLRYRIRQQLTSHISGRSAHTGRQFDGASSDELMALNLLKQMVDQESFKKYLKHGFVTVQGPSGLLYQIRRQQHQVIVWKNGKQIARLCVYLKDKVPPTDDVVAKILICRYDEIDIWRRANISWMDALEEFKRLNSKSIEEGHIIRIAA